LELLRFACGEKDDCDDIRVEYEGAQGDQGQYVNLPCIRLKKSCQDLFSQWEKKRSQRRDQRRLQIAKHIAGDWIMGKPQDDEYSSSSTAENPVPEVRFESASVVVVICRARDTLLTFSQPFSSYHHDDDEEESDDERFKHEEDDKANTNEPPARFLNRGASESATRFKRRILDGKKERTIEEKAFLIVNQKAAQLHEAHTSTEKQSAAPTSAEVHSAAPTPEKKLGKKKQAFSNVIAKLKEKNHFSRKGDVRWLLCSIVKDTVDQYVDISKSYDWRLKELRNELYFEEKRKMNFIRSLVALKRLSRRFLRDLHDIKVEIDWILRKIKPTTVIIKHIIDEEAKEATKEGLSKEDIRRCRELTMRYNDMQSRVNDFESELKALKDVIQNTKDELEHMVDSSLNSMLSLFTIV
jgi:hypothetical protein